jgi:hypothetical protein
MTQILNLRHPRKSVAKLLTGTDLANLLAKLVLCSDINQGVHEWKDHSEEFSQAQRHGSLVADAFPPY